MASQLKTSLFVLFVSSLLTGCNIQLNSCVSTKAPNLCTDNSGPPPAVAASVALSYEPIKGFTFTWTDVDDADGYRLLENPDGSSGYSTIETGIPSGQGTISIRAPLYLRMNASYILQSCNGNHCTDSAPVSVSGNLADSIGYIKASNTGAGDQFGYTVSVSGDGNTMAIGSRTEGSSATDINGDQSNNSASGAGAVYIFTRSGITWSQQAYIKASNTDAGDNFGGFSLTLSDDGNTMAVATAYEDSNATGINGDQSNNSAGDSGAAYIFTRSGTTWSQQAYIKASNTGAGDLFGYQADLSGDGDTLCVGAFREDSPATGIDGVQTNGAADSGAVYVYARSGITWSQQAYIKSSNSQAGDRFGGDCSLSDNGDVMAVGARAEDSNATGVNGDQSNNGRSASGAAYIFTRSGVTWAQQEYIKASAGDNNDFFGITVRLSGDGNTLAVGATGEDSNATGIDGDENNNSANSAGAVYVFAYSGGSWSQQAYVKALNTGSLHLFGGQSGNAISLSANGNIMAVASDDNSGAVAIDGDFTDTSVNDAGGVFIYTRTGTTWTHKSYVKALASQTISSLDTPLVSLSDDGETLVVGYDRENSGATGIGGDHTDNTASDSGAVFVY